jgi:hypothetical protein
VRVPGVDRARWLGHRWRRHGLGAGDPVGSALDDLLLLGFQDSRGGGAAQSIAARTSHLEAITVDGPLVVMWSVRGAPHAHRLDDIDLVRDALAPAPTDEGGPAYVDAVGEVAAALSAVVTGPTPKGTASHEVKARVSPGLVRMCPTCEVEHVNDGLFRAGGRAAQLVLDPEERRSTMLHPAPPHPGRPVGHPRGALLDTFLRVNGPTTRTVFRDWSGMGTETVAGLWPETVRVTVDGRRLELPEALREEVDGAPDAEGVVLVPPHDPYLRQVDRTLLVPDGARRREVWRALSPPGAVLVDGEVAGTWRYRRSDKALTVTPFERLSRAAVEDGARRVVGAPTVLWS